jgi:hypothetical protein
MKSQSPHYQTLELITNSTSANTTKSSNFASKLKQIWRVLVDILTSTNQPAIYTTESKSGVTQWIIYDPVTGYRTRLGSEEEVRIWLEQSYYQRQEKRILIWRENEVNRNQ